MRPCPSRPPERGASLIELMIALVVLSLGILSLAQLFPAGSRGQMRDRMTTAATYFAQEKIEELTVLPSTHADLSNGLHPAAGFDSLGDANQFLRRYQVEQMAGALKDLKKVTVTVQWDYMGARSVQAVTYLRR
jgi:Tfp pilus assembly protein PilV